MKKLIIILNLFLIMKAFGYVLDEHYRLFPYDADTLFLNSIAVLNSAPEYKISEIQSKNGYILFLSGSRYYLLTVTKRYQNQTEVKILPQNSDYTDGSVVAKDVFNLITNKMKNPLGLVK